MLMSKLRQGWDMGYISIRDMGNVLVRNMRYVSGGQASGVSLLCIVPPVWIEGLRCRPFMVKTLQYWPHTLVSLIPWLFIMRKVNHVLGVETWREQLYPPYENIRDDVRRWSRYFSGGVGPVLILKDPSEGSYMRSRTYICHVVRKPQLGLINSNRRAPRLRRLDLPICIVVNQ